MKTVTMNIVFEGEDAVNIRDIVMNTVLHTLGAHERKASVGITSWVESDDPILFEGAPEEKVQELVKNGTTFKKIKGATSGQYQVMVASDGHRNHRSSEACLINKYFNSFTGHMHSVKNCRDIQPDELAEMMSDHPEWFERVVDEK